MFTEDGESMDTPKRKSAINERMEDLVSAPLAVEDALVGLFDHTDHTLQRRVVETYVRRLYQVSWTEPLYFYLYFIFIFKDSSTLTLYVSSALSGKGKC